MAWFVLWHALPTVGPYRDRCVPFQIMSNRLNLPRVYFYVHVIFSVLLSLQRFKNKLLSHCHYGELFVLGIFLGK